MEKIKHHIPEKQCLFDRMDSFQKNEKDNAFKDTDPIIVVKIVFKNIKKFKPVLDKPYDRELGDILINASKNILSKIKAKYCHVGVSDITLIIVNNNSDNLEYAGRKQRIVSAVSSTMGAYVSYMLPLKKDVEELYERNIFPIFDVSVFSIPCRKEAGNVILWSERENYKNIVDNVFNQYSETIKADQLSIPEKIKKLKEEYNFDVDKMEKRILYGSYFKRIKQRQPEDDVYVNLIVEQNEIFTNTSIAVRNKRIFR